jgi:predicted MFS family arabinose efflux permease
MSSRLAALCFGNFMIGTGTLIVAGMLPAIAERFDVTVPVAGQLITVFAFMVCIGAPVLAALTTRFDRRTLLVGVQLLFSAGHLVAALMTSFPGLLAVRALSAMGAAVFTAQAAASAALLVPATQRGSAIAFVFLGWSIASVIGLPLGAYVGAKFGASTGFALVAAGSLVAAISLRIALPGALMVQPIGADRWRALFRNRAMLLLIGVTAFQGAAQFAIFSYFVPGAKSLLSATPGLVSGLFALFGITGLVGNVLAARYMDRFGAAPVALLSMISMLAGHLLWPWSNHSLTLFVGAVTAWGLGCFAINSAQQVRLVSLSQELSPVSVALNTSAIYLGQAAGTAIGGALLARKGTTDGIVMLSYVSVPLFLVAIALSISASRRRAETLRPAVRSRAPS